MKASNIEEFFGTLLESVTETWKKHLKTDKYSSHMALDEFYKDAPDAIDELVENYMGIHGKIENYKNITPDDLTAIEFLEELREMCKEAIGDIIDKDDTEICSDIDNVLSLIDSTLYKLKELTEHRATISLRDFISE